MTEQDENSARARFIRSNRKARGFHGPNSTPAGISNTDVPKWLLRTTIVAVGLLVCVVGFTVLRGGDDTPNNVLLTSSPDFVVGTCFDSGAEFWLDTATIVDCYGPHTSEIVGVIDMSDRFVDYPDPSELRSIAVSLCAIDVADRSNAFSQTDLVVGVSLPNATDWTSGQKLVLCNLSSDSGSLLTLPVDLDV